MNEPTPTNCPHCGAEKLTNSILYERYACGSWWATGPFNVPVCHDHADCARRQLAAKAIELSNLQSSHAALQRDFFAMRNERDVLRGEEGEPSLVDQLAAKDRELAFLRSWKAQAIAVDPPLQEIGHEIGVGLGQSIHDKILPWIVGTKRELNAARAELDSLPADWRKDSSLETWFPFTALELEQLRALNAELMEKLRGELAAKDVQLEELRSDNVRLRAALDELLTYSYNEQTRQRARAALSTASGQDTP